MKQRVTLEELEKILDDSGAADIIEQRLPTGVKTRQLSIRTLFLGFLLCIEQGKCLFLTEVRDALCALPEDDRRRLGVSASLRGSQRHHTLTYRQVERTARMARHAVDPEPVPSFRRDCMRGKTRQQHFDDAQPSPREAEVLEALLNFICDAIIAASNPFEYGSTSSSAIDWTDVEDFAVPKKNRFDCRDPTASWGVRKSREPSREKRPGGKRKARGHFHGFNELALVSTRDEGGPPAPELIRGIRTIAANVHPATRSHKFLDELTDRDIIPGDLLADAGFPYLIGWTRGAWAKGFRPIVDLHPMDLGPKGQAQGALLNDDRILCPATPVQRRSVPKPDTTNAESVAEYDKLDAKRRQFEFEAHGRRDKDGYQRFKCPAAAGKLRCPYQPQSLLLPRDTRHVTPPPGPKPDCCKNATMTVPPTVLDKQRGKHRYMSPEYRESYKRRTAVERAFASIKAAAGEQMTKGRLRLFGRATYQLLRALAYALRNLRILKSFEAMAHGPSAAPARTPTRARRRRDTYEEPAKRTDALPPRGG